MSATASSRRLVLTNIQEQVTAAMRDMITEGDLLPGAPLSEMTLADTFGVSRTPVREALKQLQTEGLVEIRSRVGTFVAKPTRRDITELFDLKELLEGAAARLLAARGDVPEIRAMQANVAVFERAIADTDVERYVALVHEFHNLLIVGADNSKLAAHYRILMNQLAYNRLVRTSLSQPGRPHESEVEHQQVLDLILAKDGDGAERFMRDHVRASRRAVMAGLDSGLTPTTDPLTPGKAPCGS